MIKSISVNTTSGKQNCIFDPNQKYKINIDFSTIDLLKLNAFDIEITFSSPVSQFRNHDYTWNNCNEDRIANEYCPKIIKLQNGQLVQANINLGIWEVNKKNTNVLLWRFNPEFSKPIATYLEDNNEKHILQAVKRFVFPENPALLFPASEAFEFSKSKIPFTAVACFTDHCDFDTLENLILQREFFKENDVKTTKGFFLNHFSKRNDNASFENDKEELLKWDNDGHELFYHSLSQSIKDYQQSFEDFKNFVPPLENIKVWIDHGFQPYNFSLIKNNILSEDDYANILKEKHINTLWNYIDSGTSTQGVINQFNSSHFTLSNFLKGNKNLKFVKRLQLMIKNIIFHYYNDENLILKYKDTAGNFKKLVYQKKIKSLIPLTKNSFHLSLSILSVFLFWKKAKNKPYKLAKYSPVLFKHRIAEKEFYVFQTLEMLDFQKSLSKENLNTLINEKGVFIAHTYFSVPLEYHKGKLFSTPDTIDQKVSENFRYLGTKIKNKEIWNPTLSELIEYWSGFEKIVLDIQSNGNLFLKTDTNLKMRQVT